MWQEPLPEGVKVEEPIRLAITADLRPDGTFGKEWLVVTEKRVLVIAQNGTKAETRWDLLLTEVSEPKAREFFGGGAFEVTRGKTSEVCPTSEVSGVTGDRGPAEAPAAEGARRIELVRYTAAQAPRFSTAAHVLEKWLKGEKAELPEEEVRRCPRCGLPLGKGTRVCPACLPKRRTLARLVTYLKVYRKQALGLSALSIVGTAIGLVPPLLQKPLIDRVLVPTGATTHSRLVLLALLVLGLLLAYVLTHVVGAAQAWLAAWLGNRVTHDIRCRLYGHLQYLSLRFFDTRQTGSVISRVNQDTGQLQQFLVWGSQDLAMNVLSIVGIGAVLFVLNWELALIVLVPAPLITLLSAAFWKRIRRYMHRFFHRWGLLNAMLNESLKGLRIVKAFAQEPREIARFNRRSADLAGAGIVAERTWAILFTGIGLIIVLATLLVWYVGGRQVIFMPTPAPGAAPARGAMTVGTLMAFIALLGMFYGPLRWMSQLLNWASRSLTAAERVFEVLDTEPEVEEHEAAVAMPRIEGRVEFKNVTFGYERHQPVLKGINFAVKPGEMIGLVGQSGAGKTTTINLLCRFYDADEGEILVDGVPLDRIRLDDLRHQIGLVPQDTFLFRGTIAENIAYAKAGATHEEIIRAAKVANAHDFILKKSDGYETLLGEEGQGLSAGEKQRLAIARAVLHNPRILILDEATSQVDVETEKQIQEAIQRLVAGRTTFAIAHRLSTLKNADRLIVLKEGEIVEMGTHDELLAKEGEFYKLVQTYQEISKVHAVQR